MFSPKTFIPLKKKLKTKNCRANQKNDFFKEEKALELGIYYSIEKKWNKFSIQSGLRYSWFGNYGGENIAIYNPDLPQTPSTIIGYDNYDTNELSKSYGGFEPRLSLKYDFNDRKAFKIGYNRMFQYIHLINNNSAALPNNIWKPASKHIQPLEVNQFSTGYVYDSKDQKFNFSIEGYFKNFDDILEYKNGARIDFLGGEIENLETELIPAKGFSYGLELAAYKNTGKLTLNMQQFYQQFGSWYLLFWAYYWLMR